MGWIEKDGWYYPSEHIKSFIGLPGGRNENGELDLTGVCIDHTPDSWAGFQEWWQEKSSLSVYFKNCVMPTQHIDINDWSIWLDNIKGPCDLFAPDNIMIIGDTIIDPRSKLECSLLCYDLLTKPINKSLINFNLTVYEGIHLTFDTTTPFMNCSPIGNYSLTCEFNNPVDLTDVRNIGPLSSLFLSGSILPNHVYELLMSDIKDLRWDESKQTPEMNQFLTAIKEFLPSKRKTGWVAILEFTNKYPQFSEFMPRK